MKLNVSEITGELCMTYEDGEALLGRYRELFDQGFSVDLDFANTRIHMSPFFNAGIAPLLKTHSMAEVRERLTIRNLPQNAVETLKQCLETADQYYHNPNFQKALDAVLEEHAACA